MFYLIMHSSRIRIWVILSGLALAFHWVGINQLSAQSVSEFSILFRQDSEEPISEQDIFLLEESLSGRNGINRKTLLGLAELSILSDREVLQLTIFSRKRSPKSILKDPALSARLKYILFFINQNSSLPQESIEIRQLSGGAGDLRYLWRTKINFLNKRMGFLIERDPGELKITDHSAVFLAGRQGNINWILGDHQLSTGLGLLAGSSQAPIKGFTSGLSSSRMGRGFRPYQSTNEFWGLRGLALSGPGLRGNWKLSLARNKFPGKLNIEENYPIISASLKQKNLIESTFAGGWEYEHDLVQAGFLAISQKWSDQTRESINYVYTSVYAMLRRKHFKGFGELAFGRGKGRAWVLGGVYQVKNFRYLIHFRQYERNYTGFRSSPMAEWNTSKLNEIGILQSLFFRSGKVRLTVFGDIFRQPGSSGGRQGFESGIRIEYPLFQNHLLMQWKSTAKSSPAAVSWEDNISLQEKYSSKIKYTLGRDKLKWKFQINRTTQTLKNSGIEGWGLSISAAWTEKKYRLFFNWIFVTVDSYPVRLYFWDVNLPGEMRNRAFYRPGHSPAVMFRTGRFWGSELGFRFRAIWDSFSFDSEPRIDGAFFLEAKF